MKKNYVAIIGIVGILLMLSGALVPMGILPPEAGYYTIIPGCFMLVMKILLEPKKQQ